MWSRREFLKAIGLGALVAPAVGDAAKALPAPVDPPPQLDFVVPVPQLRESPRTANHGGPDDEPALFARSRPYPKRECWGKYCQSYGKPHLTPWECSIKFNADGTVKPPGTSRLPVPTPEEWAGVSEKADLPSARGMYVVIDGRTGKPVPDGAPVMRPWSEARTNRGTGRA